MTTVEALLDSWTRQCQMLDNLLTLVTPALLEAKPSEDGWTIGFHLSHLHSTRRYWHMKTAQLEAPVGPSLFTVTGEDWIPSDNLDEIRARLGESGALVRSWVSEQIEAGSPPIGHYDHPVLYLQHMIWHEGWHFSLIVLALRLAGVDPSEEWECANIWDLWRLPD